MLLYPAMKDWRDAAGFEPTPQGFGDLHATVTTDAHLVMGKRNWQMDCAELLALSRKQKPLGALKLYQRHDYHAARGGAHGNWDDTADITGCTAHGLRSQAE